MSKPLALDLFCGLGGWADGLMKAGWEVIGVDWDKRFVGRYPAELVIADVLEYSGLGLNRRVDLVVASPDCREPSYRAMPWGRAKVLNGMGPPEGFIRLFNRCFEIAGELDCPVIVENVKGAQRWVGEAKERYGSFYLWGDVPGLPSTGKKKGIGSGSWFFDAETRSDPREGSRYTLRKAGVKQHGSGHEWFDIGLTRYPSQSERRKEASAQIAKIPFELAYHIGREMHPDRHGISDSKDSDDSQV